MNPPSSRRRLVATGTGRGCPLLRSSLAVALLTTLCLAGCGGGDEDERLTAPPPSLSTQEALIRRMTAPGDSPALATAQPASAPAAAH
jgi:hypothetical protein